MNGAGAAVRGVAADMRAGQAEVVTQGVHQQQAGLHRELMINAVDCETHRNSCAHLAPPDVRRASLTVPHALSDVEGTLRP
jgi:hypothetical protein